MKKLGSEEVAEKEAPEMHEYEVKSNLEALERAHEISQDETKMEHVRKLAGRKKKMLEHLTQPKKAGISSIKDLKETYKTKFGPKEE